MPFNPLKNWSFAMLKKLKKVTKSSPKKVQPKKIKNSASSSKKNNPGVQINRHQKIQEAAYFRAEKRSFMGGDPVEDWVAAEIEIDTQKSMS